MLASKMRDSSSFADQQNQDVFAQDIPFNKKQLHRKRSSSYPLRISPIQTQVELSRIREHSANLPLLKPSLDTIANQIVDCTLPIKTKNIAYKEQKKELKKQFDATCRRSHITVSPIELNAILNYPGSTVGSQQPYLNNLSTGYVRLPVPPALVRQKSGRDVIGSRNSYSPQLSAATAYSNKQRSSSLHDQTHTSRQPVLIASSSVPIRRRRSYSTGQHSNQNLNKTDMRKAAAPLINTLKRSLTPNRRLQGGSLQNSSSAAFELSQYIDRPLLMPYSNQDELESNTTLYSAATSSTPSSQRSISTEIVNRAQKASLLPCSPEMNLITSAKVSKGLPATPLFNRNDTLSVDQQFYTDESDLSLLPSGSSITITKERSRSPNKKSARSRNSSSSPSRSPRRRTTFYSQREY